ncbi:MAG TPA: replication factor C large subunit [Ignisphaera aggregans]|uniref:Replication factor C large subunit n=1 Tax=Ignisphaera aggregans TaxID=334771 RepID=A0A833DT87_9CREN|nr:replication factor C large subunit [Ignisphaera aggregans]
MSAERKLPWIIKYRPKRIAEVVNQEDAKAKFVEWLKKWPNVSKRAVLLYGPPGCGKTSLVEAAAHEFGYELVEMNASDFRRKSDIERVAKRAASAHSLFGAKKKIVLLDEVDGIAGREDAGGLEAILQLIKTAGAPIVMTANDPWDTRLKPLRDVSEMIQFRRLSKHDVMKVLRRICENEGLVCEEQALEYIAERSEGDLRAAINDLQAIGEGFGKVTLDLARAMLRPRDREHDPFETLRNLFSARYAWQAKMALTQSQLDYEQAKLWLLENIANQYSDPEDLARAYDALSKADVYLGRIIKSNDWDLLAYAIDMMTAGVAMAAQNNPKDKYRWVKYSFPQKLLLLSKTKEVRAIRDDIARVIASHLHTSTAIVKSEVIPFLHVIFTTNPRYAAKLAIGLGLSEKMIELLAGPAKSEVLKYYREYKQQMESIARKEAEEVTQLKSQLQVYAEAGKEKEKRESKTKRKEKTATDLTAFFRKR